MICTILAAVVIGVFIGEAIAEAHDLRFAERGRK